MAKLTFTDQSYFSRDWAMLTRDKGWIKPILLMALASLVPIVGILGVTGYAYEWARLTAWGVDSAPKQRDVKVGACIKSGFRVCMVTLCWSLAVGFVFGVLNVLCGDSALGSVKLGRDAEFQGIMPVRGKILNCLKADYGKIFKSEIITDLLKVMGCGVEVHDKHNKDLSLFNLDNLRWNKIVICTDADVDGYQIRTLILTMLWRLTPTLIQEGYVYIAESPLYEIASGGKTWFAYSEKEKADILTELDGKKATLQRSKGLGENDPEMMWMTTMNPDSRRLIRVMPTEAEATARVFDLLLGENAQGRKEHIAENGYKYLDLADIS